MGRHSITLPTAMHVRPARAGSSCLLLRRLAGYDGNPPAKSGKANVRTRRFPRFEVDLPLTLLTFWEDTPIAKAHGRCRLLGEGGLGASVAHELYVGEVVRLELPRITRVYASVRYIHGNQYGFEFAFLDHAQRCAVRQFCAAQERASEGSGN